MGTHLAEMELSSIPWIYSWITRQVRADSCHATGGSKIPGGALGVSRGTFYFLGGEVLIDGTGFCHIYSHVTCYWHLFNYEFACAFSYGAFFNCWWMVLLLLESITNEAFFSSASFNFIWLHWTSTWISPKVGNCQNLKKNTKKPKWFGKTFIGNMLPTPCWCHCWCCWKVPPSNSIFAPALIRETTTVWNPKGGPCWKILGDFCLEINTQKDNKNYNQVGIVVLFGKTRVSRIHGEMIRNSSRRFTLVVFRVGIFLGILYDRGKSPGCVHGRLLANWNHRGLCKVILSISQWNSSVSVLYC